jgi:LYR motif-containing protein 4
MQRGEILSLYRSIIKNAKVFPSKNRLRIVEEIRVEFRNNRNLSEKKAINEALEKALKGLAQLNAYTGLPKRGDWRVDLDTCPMPRRDNS